MQIDKPLRIAVLNFSHETVTFLDNDTTLDDFIYEGSPAKGEALLGYDARGYIGGFVKCAREFAGVELTGILSPLFPKTGIGSGWVTNEAFEHFAGLMLEDLKAGGPFDGVYMALHGAMAVRGVAHPEAELASRVRGIVGPDVVIAATFDPHGNEDETFLQSANLTFTAKFYPHYDMYLQGERAARTIIRALRGDYAASVATRNVPIISPTVLQWTGASPWMDLVNRALIWEAREPDVFVNVFFGFPWSDVPDVGMHIQAITNGNPALAQRIASDMAGSAWRQREALLNSAKIYGVAEGLDLAAADKSSRRVPVVIADHSDRSGAATWILREIIERGFSRTLIASVMDGKLVASLMKSARIGDAFDREVGGRVDASAGQPVRVAGRIAGMGHANDGTGSRSEWLSVAFGDGNMLVISAHLMQVIETTMLEAMGFALADFDVFVLKSRVHFRRGFYDSGFASRIYLVEPPEPFLGTVRLDGLPYKNVRLTDFYPYGDPEFDGEK